MRPRSALLRTLVLVLTVLSSVGTAVASSTGEPAPGFDLPTLDGGRAALEDWRGKLVVLHFGAGW